MKREEIARAVRAACAHLEEPYVVVFGSQAIHASFEESRLPEEALMSREVDITPGTAFAAQSQSVVEEKIEILNALVGEASPFHRTYGYYVEGIHKDVVVLPHGWANRLVKLDASDGVGGEYGRTGYCLDAVDLCAAKALAGRGKDHDFVSALFRTGLVSPEAVLERIAESGIEWPPTYSGDCAVALSRATDWLKAQVTSPPADLTDALQAVRQAHPHSLADMTVENVGDVSKSEQRKGSTPERGLDI
ncbi:hypothetical protein ONR57_22790 [Hoyosella sp. YIM 151337]|uniref:hypothetical protein n=1 Tax=Hoyosella sp. YIM 151337 TaxID=2992742 RepID=UPI00223621D6|nr:hypothetical protein [Hoyosella sp. YIM 151337]MCW4356137.1 hypothetical protein [Hoyosella sp. YIM 151337]